jgi:uncharacterized protein (TIRG00374 family)
MENGTSVSISELTLKNRTNLIGLLISLAVIIYVLVKLDWQAVYQTVKSINLNWLLPAFIMYLTNYLLRTIRFQILLDLDGIPFQHLFGVTNLYGMYLYLMPAKSGELSYPILLKSRLNVPLSTSTATLIAARFFDFATVALFLPFVLITFWDQVHPAIRLGSLVFVVIIFIIIIALLWIVRNPSKIRNFQPLKSSSHLIVVRMWHAFGKLMDSLQAIDQRRDYWRLWFLTIAIWICVQANFYFIVLGLGESLTFVQMMVISIIMVPMTLLPVQGFANLGTHEIGWAAAFSLFGYPQTNALSIAVSSHIILLFFVLILGALGFLLLRGKPLDQHA